MIIEQMQKDKLIEIEEEEKKEENCNKPKKVSFL